MSGPEGFEEAMRTLATLSRAVQRGVARTVLRDPANVLAAEVRTRAPKLQGNLEGSVTVKNNRGKRGQVEVAVTAEDPAAVPQEFGAKGDDAQPYFRPAVDGKLQEMKDVGAARITSAVDAAAKRAAARGR